MKARFGGPGRRLPAGDASAQLVDVMREQQASAGETVVRVLEQGNADGDSALRRGGRPRQDPSASHDLDRVRLRRVDRHASASARLRVVPARARPLRPGHEGADVGRRRAQDDRAAGEHDRHGGSRLRRHRHGGRPHGVRSGDGDRSRDLRGCRRACRKAFALVLVNGVIALRGRQGAPARARPGADRARAHMPSRPMNIRTEDACRCGGRIGQRRHGERDGAHRHRRRAGRRARRARKGSFRASTERHAPRCSRATELRRPPDHRKTGRASRRGSATASRKRRGSSTVIVERADPFVAGAPRQRPRAERHARRQRTLSRLDGRGLRYRSERQCALLQ